MRESFFEESKLDPYKPQYGLFSYPGTLAISKQPYEIKIIPGRDD
jgi:hypothetical protein